MLAGAAVVLMVLVTDLITGLLLNSNRGSVAKLAHAGAAFAAARSGSAAAPAASAMMDAQRREIAPRCFMMPSLTCDLLFTTRSITMQKCSRTRPSSDRTKPSDGRISSQLVVDAMLPADGTAAEKRGDSTWALALQLTRANPVRSLLAPILPSRKAPRRK